MAVDSKTIIIIAVVIFLFMYMQPSQCTACPAKYASRNAAPAPMPYRRRRYEESMMAESPAAPMMDEPYGLQVGKGGPAPYAMNGKATMSKYGLQVGKGGPAPYAMNGKANKYAPLKK